MSKSRNVEVQKSFGDAVNSGRLEALINLVSEDCVDHDPAPGQASGPGGYIALFTELRSAFPDLSVNVEHMTADDDTVAIAYTLTGTHQGTFLGVAATGKKVSARGVQIACFDNGKMVERWGSSDQLGILQQIGASILPQRIA